MKKVYEALNWASSFLEENKRDLHIGEILLGHYLQLSRAHLLASLQDELKEDIFVEFVEAIQDHVKTGKPVQHMIGKAPFYGREFMVNQHVLIPRPETEELIDHALDLISKNWNQNENLDIADVGTGSGVISITMKLELPLAKVMAVDISKDALTVAMKNAKGLGAEDIEFFQGDLLAPLIKKGIRVDVLLSNPPYIPLSDMDTLQDVVRDHDPHLALFGGESGLEFYEKMAADLSLVLKERAIVGFEIGDGQGASVSKLLTEVFSNGVISLLKDINGKERMVFLQIDSKGL